MVDVDRGIPLAPLGDEVNERFECRSFLVAIQAPVSAKRFGFVGHPAAEQVFQPAPRFEERVALHIEKDVARGRRRQLRKADRGFVRKQLVDRLVASAPTNLERCLAAELAERLGRHAGRSPFVGGVSEFGHAYDAGGLKLVELVAPHPRNQAEMIVVEALLRANVVPRADSAVLALVGILLGFVCAIERWVGLEG